MINEPFTEVYQRIWTLLLASSEITDKVQPGNRDDLSQVQGLKSRRLHQDLPQLRIEQSDGEMDYLWVSDTTRCIQKYEVLLEVGGREKLVNSNALRWAIIKALKPAVRDFGLSYVQGMRLKTLRADRKDHGVALIEIEVVMSLSDSELS